MKVLIAEPYPLFCLAVREILAKEYPKAEFSESDSGLETIKLVTNQEWAVLVLDPALSGQSGLEIVKNLKRARPGMPIVIFNTLADDNLAVRCLKAGADAYLSKETAAGNVVEAVRKVLEGGKFITPLVAEKLASYLNQPDEKPPHESLSDRELQVLRLVSEGYSGKEIAGKLSLSANTISTYRKRILKKLGCQSNAELILYAIHHHLVG